MKSVTISAKIPPSLKRKLERYKIRVSEVVRTALELEVSRVEQKSLAKRLDEASSLLSDTLTPAEILSAVRASRRER